MPIQSRRWLHGRLHEVEKNGRHGHEVKVPRAIVDSDALLDESEEFQEFAVFSGIDVSSLLDRQWIIIQHFLLRFE